MENEDGMKVKFADLHDNSDLDRLPELTDRDIRRTEMNLRFQEKIVDRLALSKAPAP